MQGQNAAVQYVLPLTVAMIMLAMGLGLRPEDFRRIADKPRAVFAGLTAQLVLLPILGFTVAYGFRLPPDLAVGLVLLTACPGGAHSNLYASLARADVALSVTLTALSGLLTIVTIPWVLRLATSVFAAHGQVPQLPIGQTMVQIFVIMGLPVAFGMLVRGKWPGWAARFETGVKTVAIILLALIVVGSIARQSDNVATFAKQAGIPVLILNLLAMAVGWLVARQLRLPKPQRRTIALEVGIQNGALAFALAAGLLSSVSVAIPAILYSILVYFTGLLVVFAGRNGTLNQQ